MTNIKSLQSLGNQLKETGQLLLDEAKEAERQELQEKLGLDTFFSQFKWKLRPEVYAGPGLLLLSGTPKTDNGRAICHLWSESGTVRGYIADIVKKLYKVDVSAGCGSDGVINIINVSFARDAMASLIRRPDIEIENVDEAITHLDRKSSQLEEEINLNTEGIAALTNK